jgi:predicted type IV restriction endonuclease
LDTIDAAAQEFDRIATEIASYGDTIRSEEDTRLKVINPILHSVLGWPMGEILTEESSGGGFIDYKLSVGGRARAVVEAKKDGRTLGLSQRSPARAFRLNGPVFSSAAAKEGIGQAIRYCGQKNAELACVTNGREWIVFRGSRLGDGVDTNEGMAFVFTSLDSIKQNFTGF